METDLKRGSLKYHPELRPFLTITRANAGAALDELPATGALGETHDRHPASKALNGRLSWCPREVACIDGPPLGKRSKTLETGVSTMQNSTVHFPPCPLPNVR